MTGSERHGLTSDPDIVQACDVQTLGIVMVETEVPAASKDEKVNLEISKQGNDF
jgi:hypothetical protein